MPELMTKQEAWRCLRIIALVAVLVLVLAPASGQDVARILAPGSTLSDNLGPSATATSYVFDAALGAVATIRVDSANGQALGLLLSDANGNVIARALDEAGSGSAAIEGAVLATGGRYFVVVYLAPGSAATDSNFDIALDIGAPEDAEAPEAQSDDPAATTPSQVLIAAGIEVRLTWSGAVDMNLQVRDPSGETLYWDSRVTNNGGVFGFDANGLCQVLSPSPEETATWQPGFLPTGSYEVLIFYREACDSSAGSIPFAVDVTVDNALAGTISGVLSPPLQGQDSVYVARFEVDSEGGATVSAGDVYPDSSLTRLPTGFDIATNIPVAIGRDSPVTGALSNEAPFQTYSFTGAAGEVISVSMQAVGPNLDTLLQIVDENGSVVGVNDDAAGTTDSLISNARLLRSGSFTIIATRYGKELGGTEGQFQLTLGGPASDAPAELTTLELPMGDIEVTLVWGTNADLQLLVRDPIGGSVFDDIPFGSSGGILQEVGNVNCIPAASGAPVSYIYWPPGRMRPGTYEVEVWYQNACSELPPPVDFTLAIAVGGETIALERQFPLVNQRFVTNFTVLPDGRASAGDGGFIDGGSALIPYQSEAFDAPVIAAGETVSGTISPSNTFDVFNFQGAAGETVTIRMSAAAQVLDTSVFLISPSGVEIAANDDGDPTLLGTSGFATDSIISGLALTENGPYTIVATRYAAQFGGTIGNYSLTLEKN
ncbi:MAG: hypothetical protein OXG39_00235 [Chloroflexi bacterium]|nr:hypothetical protein [Chloroflexota bacterium]